MIVVVGTRKGGAGKSTISLNLAALRKLKGNDVCMVDCDDQKTVTRWNEIRNQNEISPAIPMINAHGAGVANIIREQATRYNDLIIDVPGRDAIELRNSILVCDTVILPLKISMTDAWALEQDIDMLYELQMQRKALGLPLRAILFFNEVPILPNVRDKQVNEIAAILLEMQEKIQAADIEICAVQITDRDSYKKVLSLGKSIFEIPEESSTKSDNSAKAEFESLYEIIYGEE